MQPQTRDGGVAARFLGGAVDKGLLKGLHAAEGVHVEREALGVVLGPDLPGMPNISKCTRCSRSLRPPLLGWYS